MLAHRQFITFAPTTNRAIAFPQGWEESLDSIGQCTGEEPGLVLASA